ncbi:MAG: hypothetical protein A2W76_07105 [Gammaproteobacteria bacterium RIFCSPLOWO2_12_47_11]|nr:MAG: hypothetical protein A2W76_07105 [Gammaproteobacteria bacterium RIFCSPLOWO2_12_47_11]
MFTTKNFIIHVLYSTYWERLYKIRLAAGMMNSDNSGAVIMPPVPAGPVLYGIGYVIKCTILEQ